jgi:hypothetical protein
MCQDGNGSFPPQEAVTAIICVEHKQVLDAGKELGITLDCDMLALSWYCKFTSVSENVFTFISAQTSPLLCQYQKQHLDQMLHVQLSG